LNARSMCVKMVDCCWPPISWHLWRLWASFFFSAVEFTSGWGWNHENNSAVVKCSL
jgi:hypothetical protein